MNWCDHMEFNEKEQQWYYKNNQQWSYEHDGAAKVTIVPMVYDFQFCCECGKEKPVAKS